ncbi:GNAT family N-acetyltransferase [Mesorhizobium sp. B2-3-3]|nr:GNAT family N-acetyltransferase [Mesorhizobium sp. B2-3-3]
MQQGEVNERFTRWLGDPAVASGLNMPGATMGLDSFRAYVGSFDNIWRNLLAIRMLDEEPIGLIMTEIDPRHRIGSLHLIVGDKAQRRLQTSFEATRLAIWHMFVERKLEKLTFEPLARNHAAVMACRLGMLRLEGTLLSHRLDAKTGERLDQLIFALSLDEFKKRVRAVPTLPVFEGPGLSRHFVRDTARSLGRS